MVFDVVKLGEVSEVTKLAGFEFTKYIKYVPDGEIIALRALNLRKGELDLSDIKRIKSSVSDELTRSKICKHDILLTYTGNGYGDCAYVEENDKYHLAPNICKITPNTAKIDPYYLYCIVRNNGFRKLLSNYIGGSSQPTIPMKTLRIIEISLPKLADQCRIAKIMRKIDCKIRLNKEINNNLLQQSGVIFSKYYEVATERQPFTSLISVLGGGTPKTGNSDFWDGFIPFFTPKDVGSPYTFQTEKYITESGLEHCNSRLYPKNTSFVTARGTVGKVSLAGKPMAMNQSCYALASNKIDPVLVYFYVLKAVASLKHKASGAVFDAIVTRDFDTEVINVLTEEDSKTVLSTISPMMAAIHKNIEENIRLSALRDTMLPKLMSGELDISELDL